MTASYADAAKDLAELHLSLKDAVTSANSADDKDFLLALMWPVSDELHQIFAQKWAERTDAYQPLTEHITAAAKRLKTVGDEIKRIVKRIDQAAKVLAAIAKVIAFMAPFII